MHRGGESRKMAISPIAYRNSGEAPMQGQSVTSNWMTVIRSTTTVWPELFRSGVIHESVYAYTRPCDGCMYGSYPEITLTARFLKPMIERFLYFNVNSPKLQKLSTQEMRDIAAGILYERTGEVVDPAVDRAKIAKLSPAATSPIPMSKTHALSIPSAQAPVEAAPPCSRRTASRNCYHTQRLEGGRCLGRPMA